MSKEISGIKLAATISDELKTLNSSGAKLKIILVGDDPASLRYVGKKKAKAEELGVSFELRTFDQNVAEEELIDQINSWQEDTGNVGIIVQLPLPKTVDRQKVISSIKPENDVDGLRFCAGLDSNYTPPVVRAIDRVVDEVGSIDQKKVVIIGQGFLVGSPLKRFIESKYPSVEVVALGRDDENWSEQIKNADILIGAAPVKHIITADMIKEGVVLIDAGSSEEDNAISGNFARECYQKASFYTPVPGGIGPLTVAMIFENLLRK
jgi:methylenetetrahydrofolate dehydrogenase (NADP+)/methenyltetrahydrofolate cyclohydrolase